MAKIAQLEIEITSKATGVTKALNQLIKKLEQLEAAKNALDFSNVNTGGLRDLYQYINSLTRILQPLAEECRMITEAFAKLGQTGTKGFAQVAEKTQELSEKLDEMRIKSMEASNNLNSQSNSEEKVAKGADKATSANRKFADSNKNVSKTSKETHKGLGSLIKQFLRLTKLKIMRQIVRNIMEGFREGMTNLYEYSRALDSMDSASFKNTMDGYATAMLQMKNTVAAAVAPVLQQLLPLIQKLVSWFVAGANAANQFFSALQGKSTYTRATDYFQEWGDAAKDTTGKVKELQRTLLGFDEINKLNDQNNGSGSGSGASTPDYSQMFEEADIGLDFSKIEKIRKLLEKIKGIFDHIWDRVKGIGSMLLDWAKSINLDPLYDSIMGLFDSIDQLIDPFFDILEMAWEDFFGPIVKDVLENFLPRIIDTVSKVISGIAGFLEKIKPVLEPIFQIAREIAGIVLEIFTMVTEIVAEISVEVLDEIGNFLRDDIAPLIEDLKTRLEPIWDALKDALKLVGEGLLNAMQEIITAIKFIWNLDFVQSLVNGAFKTAMDIIVDALNVVVQVLSFAGYLLKGDLPEAVGALSTAIFEAVRLIGHVVLNLMSALGKAFLQIGKWMVKGIRKPATAVQTACIAVSNAIVNAIEDAVDWIINAMWDLVEFFRRIGNKIVDIINESPVAKIFGVHYDHIKDDFSDAADAMIQKWHTTTDKWKTDSSAAASALGQTFDKMESDIDASIGSVDGYIDTWKKGFDDTLDGVIADVRATCGNTVGAVANTQTTLSKNPLKIVLKANTSGAKTAIKDFRNSWNGTNINFHTGAITTSADNTLRKFVRSWDGANVRINTVLTGSGSSGNLLPGKKYILQPYANGGFPDMGSLFVAGEAGAEMVGNINGRTGVASQGEITGIADAVYSSSANEVEMLREQNALLREIAAKDFSGDISVSSVLNSMERVNRRTGRTVVAMG